MNLQLDSNQIISIIALVYPLLQYVLPEKYAKKIDFVGKILRVLQKTKGGLSPKKTPWTYKKTSNIHK